MSSKPNPYQPPKPLAPKVADHLEYVGFWTRVFATFVDSVAVVSITLPILYTIYGSDYFDDPRIFVGPADFLVSDVLPAIGVVLFWIYYAATPGKMLVRARIVDSKTGLPASKKQLVGRYLAYYLSMIPLCMGFLWVAWDPKKQGWHDRLAGTVVVRESRWRAEPVTFS